MTHRKFILEDQLAFAELSGDYNPLHIDAVAARRMLFGAPVVHGIHSVLWGLDTWLADKMGNIELRSIRCLFPKPIRVGEEVRLSLKSESEGRVKIELLSGDLITTRIDFKWEKTQPRIFADLDSSYPPKRDPSILLEDEIETKSGTLDLYLKMESATRLFPHLTKCVSPLQIAGLLSTTQLVGVECPGLYSVYSELNLVANDSHTDPSLKYAVTELDRRFGMIYMNVTVPGMAGIIKAFVRPKPTTQDGYLSLKKHVNHNEFSGQRALIIGGSRGLGEVTAKLLAAGGAEVKITFQQGQEEAERIAEEIILNGGNVGCLQYNVLTSHNDILSTLLKDWEPTHLYYFATPFIFAGVNGVFSINLFNKFCDYYIAGFLNTLNSLKNMGLKKVFYPSSVAIDETPANMGEYAAAKMAAEMLCTFLGKTHQTPTFYGPRLMRMSTDQTVSLYPVDNLDPVLIMLNHLRSINL